jgi:hypothetical protein
MTNRLLTVAICTVSLFVASIAAAEQRALLVGVGKYQNPKNNLPGIDLDLARMTDTLKIMGFKESEIHTLLDEESTAENILREMNGWLVDGVSEDDRVIFYFSGHGSFIRDVDGDETEDHVDEVLVAHDMQVVRHDGRATLKGVVSDDRIAEAIKRSASRRYLTIVDACHSGTVSRDLFLTKNLTMTGDEIFEKSFTYEDMPVGFGPVLDRDVPVAREDDGSAASEYSFVSISAAGDAEKAIGTSRGGMFTIGFSEAIKASANADEPISLIRARDEAARFIRERLDPERVHTPQVTGNPDLAQAALGTISLEGGNGPMWQRLEELVGEGQYFKFNAGKPSYVVDEAISFVMEVKEPGYLNLVTVDAEDTATVLFPNVKDNDNFVNAGSFSFPTDESGFDFAAARPLGPTLVLAFVSENPVNLRELGYEGRLPSGDFDPESVFTNVTHSATRAIKLRIHSPAPSVDSEAGEDEAPTVSTDNVESEPERPWLYASSLELTVKE